MWVNQTELESLARAACAPNCWGITQPSFTIHRITDMQAQENSPVRCGRLWFCLSEHGFHFPIFMAFCPHLSSFTPFFFFLLFQQSLHTTIWPLRISRTPWPFWNSSSVVSFLNYTFLFWFDFAFHFPPLMGTRNLVFYFWSFAGVHFLTTGFWMPWKQAM